MFKNTRKESDLTGYAASASLMSTPTVINKVIRLNKAGEPTSKDQDMRVSKQVSMQKSINVDTKENEEGSHNEDIIEDKCSTHNIVS